MKVNRTTLPIAWNEIEALEIKHPLWGTTYCPKSYAKIAMVDEYVFLNLFCEELNPKATYTQLNDAVYKDSCLEVFINFNPNHTKNYLNIEVNPLGTMCIQIGDKRKPRINLTPNFQPIPYQTKNGWGFTVEIPLEFIAELFGEISSEWEANFYKCGDECEQMHFLSWNKIETEIPNFHCPDYFGKIKVE